MAPEPHLTLRRAVETDSAVIAALHIAAWQWAYRGQLPDALLDGLTVQIDRRTARRREQLVRLSSPERTWVAEAAGQIVGFADTGLSRDADAAPDTAELYAIYLARVAVGKGIGRTLLAHALGDLRGRGIGPRRSGYSPRTRERGDSTRPPGGARTVPPRPCSSPPTLT